jgi:hypothetical protein
MVGTASCDIHLAAYAMELKGIVQIVSKRTRQ